MAYSPTPLPQIHTLSPGTSAQPEESFPAPALSSAALSSSNAVVDSSPHLDVMDESQLEDHLKSMSTSELEAYLQYLSDDQLKRFIPAELLESFDSQPAMAQTGSDTGLAPNITQSAVATTAFSGSSSTSAQLGPSTQDPWENIIVFPMRHKGRKGYDARIKQVRRDPKTTSGLSVFIQYENPQITPAAEWLDYHILRRRDNNRFIAHTGSHPHLKFKAGYQPNYILQDLRLAVDRKRKAEAVQEERIQKRIRLDEPLVASAGDSCMASSLSQPAIHWISNPAIRAGLGDRHLLLALKGRTDRKDQRTTFRTVDGQVKPWKAVSSGNAGFSEIAEEDIHETIKSYGMPLKPARANGLYMVCEGVNVGKTVRRLGESFEVNLQASVAPFWVVQEVHVQGKGRKYMEEIKDLVFSVKGNALVLIYEQEGDRAIGNAQMASRREDYARKYMKY